MSGSARATEVGRSPVGLYVHIPFCVSLCPYCDFVVYTGALTRGPRARVGGAFIAALLAEVELRAAGRSADAPPLQTVYFGGGTPSLLPSDAVAEILAHIRERFGLVEDAEVTLEANPGPDERGDPHALRRAGVTRISYGAQSLDDAELRRVGRRHRAGDVADAVAGARAAGVGSINVDLLYDIPGGTVATWMDTLDAALALAPDHLALYALGLDDPDAEGLTGPLGDHLPVRAGARRWREAARSAQDEDRAAAQYHHAVLRLGDDGFHGYEISNWARPGHESRHNLAYWRREPYAAVGPGAHAFDGAVRRWNAARLDGYLAALAPADPSTVPPAMPPGGSEAVTPEIAAVETVMLGLRLDTGVPLAAAHQPPLSDHFGWALAAELIEVTEDDRIVLTTRGRLLSNELFSRLV